MNLNHTCTLLRFENYMKDTTAADGRKTKLCLFDTAGQEEYDNIRPLTYPYTVRKLIN